MTMIHSPAVVVGVDRNNESLAALEVGAAEALARRAPLSLITAHPAQERTGPRTTLTALLRRVTAVWPELAATARNVTNDPAEALIAASRHASLLVLGRRPASTGPAGPVAAQVAAHAECPTLVVPADHPGGRAPVLAGVAMSTADEPVLGFAFEEAALRGAGLRAVHVWSGLPAVAVGQMSPFAFDLGRAQQAADQQLAEVLEPWVEKYPQVPLERMPLYDPNPARTLLEAGALAELVVVGSHRPDLRGSQLLGATTRLLLSRAPYPVAVVRPGHYR